MAKWEVIDNADAPEDLTGLTPEAKERREIFAALAPGKTIVIAVAKDQQKGYKAALSRMGTIRKTPVRVWNTDTQVCIRLAEPDEVKAKEETKTK